MSLNFVSTSVLSSSDGVYTETQLQPTSSDSLATHRKPLYEQLRENAEKDQEKYDEVTKAMRGTTTLDDEDVAFIQGVEDRKEEVMNNTRRKEEEEIQMFRAARLEKTMIQSEVVVNDGDGINVTDGESANANVAQKESKSETTSIGAGASSRMSIKPTIIKKRRRKIAQAESQGSAGAKKLKQSDGKNDSSVQQTKQSETAKKDVAEESGLSGLLAYGSDSDSD
jgi:hypothetical protein